MSAKDKESKVFWLPIYDDWTQGWTPITIKEDSIHILKKNEITERIR